MRNSDPVDVPEDEQECDDCPHSRHQGPCQSMRHLSGNKYDPPCYCGQVTDYD